VYYIIVVAVAVCFSLPVLAVFYHCDFVTWLANYIVSSSTKVKVKVKVNVDLYSVLS